MPGSDKRLKPICKGHADSIESRTTRKLSMKLSFWIDRRREQTAACGVLWNDGKVQALSELFLEKGKKVQETQEA